MRMDEPLDEGSAKTPQTPAEEPHTSQPVVVNAVLKTSGKQAVMEGSFVMKRLDFGIGGGTWGDVRVVANEVTVQFHLVLEP